MRQPLFIASALIAATLATGCTTVSESDFKTGREYIAANPSVKRDLINDCIAERRRESADEKRTTAALLNVSVANYPQAFCKRLINAVSNGRLTYADINRIENGSQDYSKIIRILQGR